MRKYYYIVITTGFLSLLFFCSSLNVFASYADELQEKIDIQNQEIERLEEEIASYKNELNETVSTGQTLAGAVKELDINQKKLEADIKVSLDKITRTELTIEQLGLQIDGKKNTITNFESTIAKNIRNVAENDRKTFTMQLLGERSMSDAWRQLSFAETIQKKMIDDIKKLALAKTDLEGKKITTETEKNKLVSYQNQLSAQKKIILSNKQDKQKLLTLTKNQESSYKALIADSEKKKEQIESEIRNYETQLKFILDPSSLPEGKVLSWPLDNIKINQLFGKATGAAARLYASGSHSGVDFFALIGTPVYAMAEGTVDGVGNTDIECPKASFGKYVFIRYKNGLASAYGHLSEYIVSKGQSVHKGELVGYTGNTGHTTGPHLHVSVYADSSVSVKTQPNKYCRAGTLTQPFAALNGYLDPLFYLPPLPK